MTPHAHIRLLLAAAAASVGLAACGGADEGEPIQRSDAALMQRQLNAVQDAVDESACEDVGPAVTRLQTTIADLDATGVGDDVQDALSDGADNLRGLATSECTPEEEPVETTPETVPETTAPPPEATETTPPPTTTQPETTIPEAEPEPLPKEEDDGDGSGGASVPRGHLKKGEGG